MSSNITDPSNPKKSEPGVDKTSQKNASPCKGKAKEQEPTEDHSMEVEDDDDDDDEEGEMGSEDEDEEEDEDDLKEIDPKAIVGRRTRGVKVDYTSQEALKKAGLNPNDDDEESDADVAMKD